MTVEEALERVRARWEHPPLSPADVAERVALRYRDRAEPPPVRVLPCPPACRVFWRLRDDEDIRRRRWASAYVHALGEVDEVLAQLEARAESFEARRLAG